MSKELDRLLDSSRQTAITDHEEILKTITELSEQSISIFKPRKVQGSNYNFIVNMISSGFGLSASEMKNAKFKELIFLLNKARTVSYFECYEEGETRPKTLFPAGIAGRVAVMMNDMYKRNYQVRRFLKISYADYLQLMYEASGKSNYMKKIIFSIEDVVRKSSGVVKPSKGDVVTLKNVISGLTFELNRVYIPGVRTVQDFDKGMRDWHYVMYNLFAIGLVTILDLKNECDVKAISEKYGRKTHEYSFEELLEKNIHKEK